MKMVILGIVMLIGFISFPIILYFKEICIFFQNEFNRILEDTDWERVIRSTIILIYISGIFVSVVIIWMSWSNLSYKKWKQLRETMKEEKEGH